MRRFRWLFPALLVLTVVVIGGVAYGAYRAFTGAGLSLNPAVPEAVVPASADIYVTFNHSSAEQATLTKLWNTYLAHPGTRAAVAHVQSTASSAQPTLSKKCTDALQGPTSLLSSLGDHLALAVWLPAGSAGQAQVALVAQTTIAKIGDLNSLVHSFATFTDIFTYNGVQVYQVTSQGTCGTGSGLHGYGALVSGDAIFTPERATPASPTSSEAATIEHVIDGVQGKTTALSKNGDYQATMATLPAARLLTVYVARHVSQMLQQQITSGTSALSPQQQRLLPRVGQRPYALDVIATAHGLGLDTSTVPVSLLGNMTAYTTPNQGASIVGANTILYGSQSNLAALLRTYLQLVPASQIRQLEQQTGLSLERDVLSWMNGEWIIDVNSSVSPALAANSRQLASSFLGSGASSAAPAVPGGALEIAFHVDNPAAVQQSLDRITAAVARASSNSPTTRLTTSSVGGATVHTLAPALKLPGIGYALRGHWLIISTNIQADAQTTAAPLASDADYTEALAHVTGSGALGGVSYFSITNLLGLVDSWIAYANQLKPGTVPTTPSSPNGWTWAQAEPLIAPLHSLIAYSQKSGAKDAQLHIFLTVK